MILKADNIVKSYTKLQRVTPVLKNVSLTIEEGEFVAVVGPSGAGKSTLLHIIGGIDHPDSGKSYIYLDNKEFEYSKLSGSKLSKIRNKYLGFIFQFHHLLPEFSAIENIMLPAMIGGLSYNKSKDKAKSLLKIVGLDIRESHKPTELSGGEQQRVAIARALINEPKIVFADEPTGNLDRDNSTNILNLIQSLQKQLNITFIIATHSDDVAKSSHRIISMKDGIIEV